jgi:flagellar basal body-associated protein FliL
MLKNKKIMIALALPVLLLAGYTFTKPRTPVKTRIKGTIYEMPQPFLLNLSDGRYVKLSVALELAPGQSDGAAAGAGASSGSSESAGTLPEEPLVRELVTNTVTNQSGEALIDPVSRTSLRHRILQSIERQTDVKVEAVLFPELTVQ